MLKQMMKLAGARDEKHFLEMFPKESDFIKKHGGEMLYMYGGGYYADGGMAPEEAAMMQQQQGQPQQGGGDQMQELVQFIAQALQQGMQPEEIVQKLVEAGLPQDQAGQLVEAVIQQMQGGGGQGGGQPMPAQGPQGEMMEGPQGQEAPPQEMMQGQPPMKMGGTPCYNCGGSYAGGGTYYQGNYYAQGGPFVPQYGDIAWNVDYAAGGEAASGGGNELVMQVAQLLQQGVQPEAILQQLVQAKIPQKKAIKLIQTVMQKMQGAQASAGAEQAGGGMMAYGGPYMPLSSRGNTTDFEFGGPTYSKVTQYNRQGIVPALDWMGKGGSVKKYKKGGEYEMTHDDVQKLIQQGYKIQYL